MRSEIREQDIESGRARRDRWSDIVKITQENETQGERAADYKERKMAFVTY